MISMFFIRHWRGELSLAVSFWVNYFLLSLAFFLARWVPYVDYFDDKVRAAIALELVIYAVAALALPWQVVGVWRSASRRIRSANKRLWSRTAQGLVTLGVFLPLSMVVWLVLAEAPLLGGIAQALFKPHEYEVTFSDGGNVVTVSGYIEFGLTKQVGRYLDQNPQVAVIRLESRGGRESEALQLGHLIKARRVGTYVSSYCHSACTYVFIAGNVRIIQKDARLGFHKGNFQSNQEQEKRFFLSQSVDKAFAEKAFAVPHEALWYPSVDELIQAGVVTHVEDGDSAQLKKVER